MKRKLQIKFLATTAVLLAIGSFAAQVYAQSGGDFIIRQSVVSNGGGAGSDAGKTFSILGTIGQTAVGSSSNKSFNLYGGFLAPQTSPPPAAEVTVGGRITTADGRGIRNVIVSMINTAGEIRTAISTTFGYYRFTSVPGGETYIFAVSAKRFQFSQTVQIRLVNQDTGNINFVAVN